MMWWWFFEGVKLHLEYMVWTLEKLKMTLVTARFSINHRWLSDTGLRDKMYPYFNYNSTSYH